MKRKIPYSNFESARQGSPSEKYRELLYTRCHADFDNYRKSKDFIKKSQMVQQSIPDLKINDPIYLDRRIRECRKEIRKYREIIDRYDALIYMMECGQAKQNPNGEPLTTEEVTSWVIRDLGLMEKAIDKQSYYENCLDALGTRFSRDDIKVGYIVRIMRRCGQAEIISTGQRNVGYKFLTGSTAGTTSKAPYAHITEIIKAEEKQREPHPFTVGEQFTAVHYHSSDKRFPIFVATRTIYEIVRTTDTTIQLRPVGTDDKPITRKPRQMPDGGWRFAINRQNTFYHK